MKTCVAVYEEGLFALKGGQIFFKGGANAPPPKETLLEDYLSTGMLRGSAPFTNIWEPLAPFAPSSYAVV